MLKQLFLFLLIAVVAVSCLKSNDENSCPYVSLQVNAPQAEQDSIKAYLDSNNIDAERHPSGLYYKIINPGSGTDSMTLCSRIMIDYKGQFANGEVFDEGYGQFLVLGALIEGWKKGIPLIKKGGEIKLFVPPTLGYGPEDLVDKNNGQVIIPGKSMLIFDVKLIDFESGY